MIASHCPQTPQKIKQGGIRYFRSAAITQPPLSCLHPQDAQDAQDTFYIFFHGPGLGCSGELWWRLHWHANEFGAAFESDGCELSAKVGVVHPVCRCFHVSQQHY